MCKLCVKECYNHEISQINSEPLAAPVRSNDKNIIDRLLKRIEQLEKDNSELKQKLEFYENKEKGVIFSEATEKETESYEKIALSQSTYRNDNLLNLDYVLEFKDRYKVNVKGIIDTEASKCHVSPYLFPSEYIESVLYKAEDKDVFDEITILENKLIDCAITFSKIKYPLSFVWVKSALGKK